MSSNLYSQGYGTTSSSNFLGSAVKQTRSPTSGDIQGPAGQYPVGQLWVDTTANASWQLTSFVQLSGSLSANWTLLGGAASDVNTLSGDSGVATPTIGDIKIAGGAGIVTSASGSTVTVALIGGDQAIDQIAVDASTPPGTDPVKADINGEITVTGGQVAAGTISNVIRTNSTAANAYFIEIQRTTAAGVSSTANNGVGSFNSAHFTVDANGYVELLGGGAAIDSFIPNFGTSPVVPNASGEVTMTGSGSTTTVGGLNSLSFELTGLTNHNVLVGAGTSTITNVSPSTAGFVLTSNGASADPSFQTVSASGAITTITGDSGGSQVPLAGNFNILGTGSITTVGTANTETVQLTGLTNHSVLVGAGTATITKVGPTATAGQVLQSAGSSADPAFSTATYPSTTTINQILYSSAANTVTGLSTANRAVLTTGATGIPVLSALATDGQLIIGSTVGVPTAATLTPGTGISITNGSNSITISTSQSLGIVVQTFTSNGTYTPTTGMVYCIMEVIGGGGGSGGCATAAAGQYTTSIGGGGGGYSRRAVSAATVGASQTVTVGAAGTAGTAGNNAGGAGGTTTIGSLIQATGGAGGTGGASAVNFSGPGVAGGIGSLGTVNVGGGGSGAAFHIFGTAGIGSFGGSGIFSGSTPAVSVASGSGSPGNNFGGGASGNSINTGTGNTAGQAGGSGIAIITEFVLS